MSNRKKLQEAEQRLEELLCTEDSDVNLDEVNVDEEVKSICDSLDEISKLYESGELKPSDTKLYEHILEIKLELSKACILRRWEEILKDYETDEIDYLSYPNFYKHSDLDMVNSIVSNIKVLNVRTGYNYTHKTDYIILEHPQNENLNFSIGFQQSTLNLIYESLWGKSLEEAKEILNVVDDKDLDEHKLVNVGFWFDNYNYKKTLKLGLGKEQFQNLLTQLVELLQEAEKSM